nr:hypothetical protein Itr_chr05CG02930 [Ipomoea trifida]
MLHSGFFLTSIRQQQLSQEKWGGADEGSQPLFPCTASFLHVLLGILTPTAFSVYAHKFGHKFCNGKQNELPCQLRTLTT